MTFVRRSRKGRIHIVRERIANGYSRLSTGLMKANKSVLDGVWNVHKGLQLGLAKGHYAVQSGLKGVQDLTGDFSNENLHLGVFEQMSYYQYEPPVAMFSMAEVDKYNRYEGTGMALFAIDLQKRPPRGSTINLKKGPIGGGPKKLTGYGKQVRGVIRGAEGAMSGAVGAGSGALRGMGTGAGRGLSGLGKGLQSAATGMGDNFVGKGVSALGRGTRQLGLLARKNPRLAAAAMLASAAGAAGGGTMFMRRRRSKNGKIIVEQVRR